MRAAWLVFKLLESLLGCICIIVHIVGFLNVAVRQDLYFYIITFSTFTAVTMFGCLSICLNKPRSESWEVTLNALASLTYVGASMITLYHAEKDLYLIYLTATNDDFDEPEEKTVHPFFQWSKTQAIAALSNSVMHLIHSVLTFDILWSTIRQASSDEEEDQPPVDIKPQLFIGGKYIHLYLLKYKWFRRLDGKYRPEDLD